MMLMELPAHHCLRIIRTPSLFVRHLLFPNPPPICPPLAEAVCQDGSPGLNALVLELWDGSFLTLPAAETRQEVVESPSMELAMEAALGLGGLRRASMEDRHSVRASPEHQQQLFR